MLPEIPDALRLEDILLILVPFAVVRITVIAITCILTRQSVQVNIRTSEEGLIPYGAHKYKLFQQLLSVRPHIFAPCVHFLLHGDRLVILTCLRKIPAL